MDNLDSIASFMFDDMEELEEVIEDQEIKEEEAKTAALTNLVIEDIDSSDDFESFSEDNSEEQEDSEEEDLLISLGQYGRYWRIEASKDKSDVNTKGARIPSTGLQNIKNQSTTANREDNVLKFVEAYINNTQSTELRTFRLWIERKDQELAALDETGLLRGSIIDLTKQRDIIYKSHRDEAELKTSINKLISMFEQVSSGHNLIKQRYSSVSSRASELVDEIDGLFNPDSGYYSRDVVRIDDLFLCEGKDTVQMINDNYCLASLISVCDTGSLHLTCACGQEINAPGVVRIAHRKGSMFMMVRHEECPNCHKLVVIHRNIIIAMEKTLRTVMLQQHSSKDETTTISMNRNELTDVYNTLASWKTPPKLMARVSTEQYMPNISKLLDGVDVRRFVESFLETLEIKSLNQTSDRMQMNIMEYLINCNGLNTKTQSIANFLYNLCATPNASKIAAINENIMKERHLQELRQEFVRLGGDKEFEPYIYSEKLLGATFLKQLKPKKLTEKKITKEELTGILSLMENALKITDYEEYLEYSKQLVDPSVIYYSGLGKYIDEMVANTELHDAFVLNLFDSMVRYLFDADKIVIFMPEEQRVTVATAKKIVKSKEMYVDALTLFTGLGKRMEGDSLIAAKECKRLNKPFFSSYIPPINIELPGDFGRYYLYLTIMKSRQELRKIYLGVTYDQQNPWEANFEKTLLLYAIVNSIGKYTKTPDKCEKLKAALEEWKE